MTGGCGATPSRIHHVYNRGLVAALTKGGGAAPANVHGRPRLDEQPKIVYVHGTIDLNVDDRLVPLKEEDYMRMCNYTAHETFYDPITGNQTGTGGFFGAYKAAYDPNLWIRQSLDPVDNRPPALTGPLEEARLCFQRKQAERVVVDVGSNTSIVGAGVDARIINGNLRWVSSIKTIRPIRPGTKRRTSSSGTSRSRIRSTCSRAGTRKIRSASRLRT